MSSKLRDGSFCIPKIFIVKSAPGHFVNRKWVKYDLSAFMLSKCVDLKQRWF
jgi:hypothetical protein